MQEILRGKVRQMPTLGILATFERLVKREFPLNKTHISKRAVYQPLNDNGENNFWSDSVVIMFKS